MSFPLSLSPNHIPTHPHVPIFSCSLSPSGTCPVLCSSNGEYEEGACRCYPGWKGAECSIRHNECEVSQKHFHFLKHFFNYTCDKINARFLKPFWKSLSFRKYWIAAAICSIQEKHLNNCHWLNQVPDCNNHGNCFNGECQCSRGYTGSACQQGKTLMIGDDDEKHVFSLWNVLFALSWP